MPRRRPEFEPGEAGVEAAKLKKFSDADGSQSQWLPDAGRNRFLKLFRYNRKRYTLWPQAQSNGSIKIKGLVLFSRMRAEETSMFTFQILKPRITIYLMDNESSMKWRWAEKAPKPPKSKSFHS